MTTTTSTSTTTSTIGGSTYPGTVTSVTIKGNIGGASSTSTTSTSTTDVTTQVIEKQEIATKYREEATRIKEVGTTQTTELEEMITHETE